MEKVISIENERVTVQKNAVGFWRIVARATDKVLAPLDAPAIGNVPGVRRAEVSLPLPFNWSSSAFESFEEAESFIKTNWKRSASGR
jgi:hypothetical protein